MRTADTDTETPTLNHFEHPLHARQNLSVQVQTKQRGSSAHLAYERLYRTEISTKLKMPTIDLYIVTSISMMPTIRQLGESTTSS